MLKKTFLSRDIDIFYKINVSSVKPHLDYAVHSLCPILVMDIEALEKV